MNTATPVGRIVIRPTDETKAIIGITKGADPSLKPGMVYEIRKDDTGVMTLHEVGESCIRGPVKSEDMRENTTFSWAHDVGLIFDAMGVDCVTTIDERRVIADIVNSAGSGIHRDRLRFFLSGVSEVHSKPLEVEQALSEVFRLVDVGDTDAALGMTTLVREKYCNLPELTKATVSLRRKAHYANKPVAVEGD